MKGPGAVVALALLLAAAAAAAPAEGGRQQPVWQVAGEHNVVYLLGSVHLLRAGDYPLAEPMERAYEEADALLMELDMDDLDELQMARALLAAGTVAGDSDLRELLGPQVWEEASSRAGALGVRLESFATMEPWFAALTIVSLEMARLGFDASQGIEAHFVRRARADQKEIRGLETLSQQLAIFDGMPLQTQRRFLLKTLDDAGEIADEVGALIAAWKQGDVATLERELVDAFDGFPQVYQTLVVSRNRDWTRQIRELLDDERDYLVVVGALHLVGKDSVLAMLRDSGVAVHGVR